MKEGVKLIRFKDNTYCWNNHGVFSDIMPLAKARAYGAWELRVPNEEINKALKQMGESTTSHYVSVFSVVGHFLGAETIDVTSEEEASNGEEDR